MDRFAIIEFGYSKNIELSISNGNTDLVEFIHGLRNEAEEKGIRAVFSYRALMQVTKLESAGMDLKEIILIVVVKGLDKDTLKTLTPEGNDKYHRALQSVRLAA